MEMVHEWGITGRIAGCEERASKWLCDQVQEVMDNIFCYSQAGGRPLTVIWEEFSCKWTNDQ